VIIFTKNKMILVKYFPTRPFRRGKYIVDGLEEKTRKDALTNLNVVSSPSFLV